MTGYRFTDGTWKLDVAADFTPASSVETRYVKVEQEPPGHFQTSTRVDMIARCP